MSWNQEKLVSACQNGCGAFCQDSMNGLAKSVSGDSKEGLGTKSVPARMVPLHAVKVSRPSATRKSSFLRLAHFSVVGVLVKRRQLCILEPRRLEIRSC